MRARTKFIIGGSLVLATVGYLMASGIKDTGVYYLTPTELAAKVQTDHSFYNVGVKMGARVVTGSITRDVATQMITFRATDGAHTFPVVYHGLAPDTFTDGVDVVVEGRLMPDGTFRATTLLAKCASRYEAVPPPSSAAPTGTAPAATAMPHSAT